MLLPGMTNSNFPSVALGLCQFSSSVIIYSREIPNHPDIPHNIISVHYTGDIMLLVSDEQEVASTSHVLVKYTIPV